jgi:hypothetical protein
MSCAICGEAEPKTYLLPDVEMGAVCGFCRQLGVNAHDALEAAGMRAMTALERGHHA